MDSSLNSSTISTESNTKHKRNKNRSKRNRKYKHHEMEITFLQLNTQKSELPTRSLLETATQTKGPKIILITEPHCNRSHIPTGNQQEFTKFFHYDKNKNPRAAIYITKDIATNAKLHNELSDRDTCTISLETKTPNNKTNKRKRKRRSKLDPSKNQLYIISSYLDCKKEITGEKLDKTATILENRNAELIVGTDCNAHHKLWGNLDNNQRGKDFLGLALNHNLIIRNQGTTPTWSRKKLTSVIDLTLATTGAPELTNWKVISGVSKSDHELIKYSMKINIAEEGPKRKMITDWTKFKSETGKLAEKKENNTIETDIDNRIESINKIMTESKKESSKIITTKIKLTDINLTALERRILTKQNKQSIEHKKEQTKIYNRRRLNCLLKKAKNEKFKEYCEKIEKIPEAARANKILTKEYTQELGTLKKEDGTSTTNTNETLKRLAEGLLGPYRNDTDAPNTTTEPIEINQEILDKITSPNRLKKAIDQLKTKKTPGPDNISNEMIKNSHDLVKTSIQEIIKQSFATGVIPKTWNNANSAIISKPNKPSYDEVKSRRIISLTSNTLKLAETLMLWYFTEDCEIGKKLHKNQMGFRAGFSTDAAIAKVINKIEKCKNQKGHVFGVFLDIQGAFDNLPHDKIEESLKKTKAEQFAIRWITNMIKSRTITLKSGPTTLTWKISKGCPQGGVLSPFLWNLVLDDLLTSLNLHGNLLAYADDLLILQEGSNRNLMIAKETTREHVSKIYDWCRSKGLELSTLKTQVVLWSKSKNKPSAITINGQQIEIKESAIYLGVHIDESLKWTTHIEHKLQQCNSLFQKLKKAIGKKWGLKPKVIKWIYQAIVLPKLAYGAVGWACNLQTDQKSKLAAFQAQYTRAITGANKSTPLLALNAITGIQDINLYLKQTYLTRALSLIAEGHWDETSYQEKIHKNTTMNTLKRLLNIATDTKGPIENLKTDKTKPETNLEQTYSCTIGTKKEFKLIHHPDTIEVYTDGSKDEVQRTGYGAHIIDNKIPNEGRSILGRMEPHNSVAQAELQAIETAANQLTSDETTNRQITILSDSASSIQALDKIKIKSHSVSSCKNALTKLTKRNTVKLIWIPSHSNYDGNEIADILAKAGSKSELPIIPTAKKRIPHTTLKHRIRKYIKDINTREIANWQNNNISEDCAPIFNLTKDNDKAQEILINLPKNSLRTLTKALTGHNELNKRADKLLTASTSHCRDCAHLQKTDETALHLINDCPAHTRLRQTTFGSPTINFNELTKTLQPTTLINNTLIMLEKTKFNNKKPPFNTPQSPQKH